MFESFEIRIYNNNNFTLYIILTKFISIFIFFYYNFCNYKTWISEISICLLKKNMVIWKIVKVENVENMEINPLNIIGFYTWAHPVFVELNES